MSQLTDTFLEQQTKINQNKRNNLKIALKSIIEGLEDFKNSKTNDGVLNDDDPYVISSNKNKGYFMIKIIRELNMITNNYNSHLIKSLISNSEYKEEILLFAKICSMVGISNPLFSRDKSLISRNFMRERFWRLTGDKKYWDSLEAQLDWLIKSQKVPDVRKAYLNKIDYELMKIMNNAVIYGFIDNRFNNTNLKEEIYRIK